MEQNKTKRLNKKNYIFAIVVLSILLILSLVYNFLGGFAFRNYNKNNLVVGDDYTIKLDGLGASSVSFSLDGSSLPGDRIKQKLQIVIPDIDTKNLILRAKVTLNDNIIEINGFDFWELDEQKKYYNFKNEFFKNQTIGLCDEIKLKQDISLKPNIVYYVNVTVELFNQLGLTE